MPTSKYVQLHPTNTEDNVIDESVNIYPIIGPGSFEGFKEAGETFEPQEKLINETNIKSITVGSTTTNLLTGGNLNLNGVLLNLLYPVGAIYTSVTDPNNGACPIQATLGGTWERIKNVFLFAKGDIDLLGDTGGSKDAVVVEHNHGTTTTSGSHVHSFTTDSTELTGRIKIKGSDTNGVLVVSGASGIISTTDLVNDDDRYNLVINASGHKQHRDININATHIHTGTTQESGEHRHSVNNTGVSGIGKNMPPYLVVMAWKRVS